LIQDHDPSKENYGDVAAHPELIDVNYGEGLVAALASTPDGTDRLRSIGYVASSGKQVSRINPDWTHINSVAYNAKLDQIILSVHAFNEIWIIDHSTMTAEAAGHTGGRGGKGGDLLYRWGNPRAYRAGSESDQRLFAQHDAHWIPPGVPGEGNLLVFNNGSHRPDGDYSSVEEIVLPADGQYFHSPGAPYGPKKPLWMYAALERTEFFSMLISGAQRLPNGNTLICSGLSGTIFEVTPSKEIVWKYTNPLASGPPPRGPEAPDGFTPGVLPVFRAHRYAPDYPGLLGKDLTPGRTIEELAAEDLRTADTRIKPNGQDH
jgi:hypothetical protein